VTAWAGDERSREKDHRNPLSHGDQHISAGIVVVSAECPQGRRVFHARSRTRLDSIDRIDRLADNAQSVPKRRLVSKILDPRSAALANSRFRFSFATPEL
jgi:hypothetical protein